MDGGRAEARNVEDSAPTPVAHDDSTRVRLLDAAAEIFAEKGYDGTRVQEIARRAGLTTGAIYANFSGKADLLLEVVRQHGGQELEELLHRTPAEGQSTLDLLADLGVDLLATSHNKAANDLLFEAIAAARRDPEVARFLAAEFKGADSRLRSAIDEIREEGMLDNAIDPQAAVWFCHAIIVGVLVLDALSLEPPTHEAWSTLLHRVAHSFSGMPD